MWLCGSFPHIFANHMVVKEPIQIFCATEAVVRFSNDNKTSSVCSHMNVKFLVAKERIGDGQVSTEHIRRELMLAGPLTKVRQPGNCCGLASGTALTSFSLLVQ